MHDFLCLSQTDLALPSSLSEAECLDQMLPSWATSFLSPEVLEKFLSLVDQDGQVTLVDLIGSSSALQEIGQRLDLGRQNGDLNLATACIGTGALDFLCGCARVLQKD